MFFSHELSSLICHQSLLTDGGNTLDGSCPNAKPAVAGIDDRLAADSVDLVEDSGWAGSLPFDPFAWCVSWELGDDVEDASKELEPASLAYPKLSKESAEEMDESPNPKTKRTIRVGMQSLAAAFGNLAMMYLLCLIFCRCDCHWLAPVVFGIQLH